MTTFGGMFWDASTNSLDISGGNINVKDTIHFKGHNTTFNGTYNTLSNKPILGTKYKYNNNTTLKSVAVGEVRFNNTTITSATQFSINLTDVDSNNNTNFIASFTESTNTNNTGTLYFHEEDDYKNGVIFVIQSLASSESTFRTFTITSINIQGNGLTKNLNYIITFSGTGDGGSQGATGGQGTSGTNGSQGTQGIQGTSGTKGSQGTQGIQGIAGEIPKGSTIDFINGKLGSIGALQTIAWDGESSLIFTAELGSLTLINLTAGGRELGR